MSAYVPPYPSRTDPQASLLLNVLLEKLLWHPQLQILVPGKLNLNRTKYIALRLSIPLRPVLDVSEFPITSHRGKPVVQVSKSRVSSVRHVANSIEDTLPKLEANILLNELPHDPNALSTSRLSQLVKTS